VECAFGTFHTESIINYCDYWSFPSGPNHLSCYLDALAERRRAFGHHRQFVRYFILRQEADAELTKALQDLLRVGLCVSDAGIGGRGLQEGQDFSRANSHCEMHLPILRE
jgi:hypothetical protein